MQQSTKPEPNNMRCIRDNRLHFHIYWNCCIIISWYSVQCMLKKGSISDANAFGCSTSAINVTLLLFQCIRQMEYV